TSVLGVGEYKQGLEVVDRQAVCLLQVRAQQPRGRSGRAQEPGPRPDGRYNRLLCQSLRHQGIMVELVAYSIVHDATKGAKSNECNSDDCPGRYLEPRSRSLLGRFRGLLP